MCICRPYQCSYQGVEIHPYNLEFNGSHPCLTSVVTDRSMAWTPGGSVRGWQAGWSIQSVKNGGSMGSMAISFVYTVCTLCAIEPAFYRQKPLLQFPSFGMAPHGWWWYATYQSILCGLYD